MLRRKSRNLNIFTSVTCGTMHVLKNIMGNVTETLRIVTECAKWLFCKRISIITLSQVQRERSWVKNRIQQGWHIYPTTVHTTIYTKQFKSLQLACWWTCWSFLAACVETPGGNSFKLQTGPKFRVLMSHIPLLCLHFTATPSALGAYCYWMALAWPWIIKSVQ